MPYRVVRAFAAMCFCLSIVVDVSTFAEGPKTPVRFEMHRIGDFRTEACGVGDFNNDGRLDVVAGEFLYLAPDWKAHRIREIKGKIEKDGNGYLWDFMNAPLDVDGDGWLDVVACSWHGKRIDWHRNPGKLGSLWKETLVEENGNFECGDLWDIDGDGKPLEILPMTQHTAWYELGKTADGKRGLVKHVVCEEADRWGGGVGDVNGDGRPDILRPGAWFEAPEDPRKGEWKKHPLAVGHEDEGKADHTPQILVYDVNEDGLNDIVTSVAHRYGIFWYEQRMDGGKRTWKRHLIDDSWSQAHSFVLEDIDGDGDLDLVTGKRYKAHNGGDPGSAEPVGVYWYELKRGKSPKWIKHIVSYDEGIGSGLALSVVDFDGDGDFDIVVCGKWGGPVWFENKLK